MRITIFTAGSQGDIQPCILLGQALQQAGFQILLAAPENFAHLIQRSGLSFHTLHGDVQQVMAGETGRKFMESGGANPVRAMLAMRKMIQPIALQMAEDALEACGSADALISLAVFAPIGKTLAEIRDIPLIYVEPTPMLPSAAFPLPGWPLQRNMGGLLNRFSGSAMLRLIWQWYAPSVNEFRGRFGLRAYRGASFKQILTETPLLSAYSPAVIPHPVDWSDHVHITGYWFPNAEADWQPAKELEAFLDAGDPPVYVGFGSMGGSNPERLAAVVLEALAMSERRGVLLTGWGGMKVITAPEKVCVIDAAPHSRLFPRMAAVVHHGGAGTTAEGLRAGKPTVIVPFIVDQAFWGKRVYDLGVGPEPIPAKKLTADRLADAIYAATSDPKFGVNAGALGRTIRREDGLAKAVSIVKQILETGP